MNMNDRFGRTLVLLAILFVAGSATASGTDLGESRTNFRSPSTNADKAAEARRLAAQAGQLAQRAAALAAESQAPASAASASKRIQLAAPMQQQWNSSDAAEVLISDADIQPAVAAMPTTGWRRHQKDSELAIRFTDAAAASAPNSTAGENAAQNAPIQTPAGSELTSVGSEPRQSPPVTATKPSQHDLAAQILAQSGAGGAVEPQALQDGNVKLVAASYNDSKVQPADGEEPMPAAAPPYDDHRGPRHDGNGDSCECGDVACCEPQRMLIWTSGVEATFLNPDLNSLGATFEVEEFADERFDDRSTASDDPDSIYMSPRIWIRRPRLPLGRQPPLLALAGDRRKLRPDARQRRRVGRSRLRHTRLRLQFLQRFGSLHGRPGDHAPLLPPRLLDAVLGRRAARGDRAQ